MALNKLLYAQSVWRFWTQIEIHPGTQIDSGVYRPQFRLGDWRSSDCCKKGVLSLSRSDSRWDWKDVGKRHPAVRKVLSYQPMPKLSGPVEIGENAKVSYM